MAEITTATKKSIAARIQERRYLLRLSQDEVADRLEVPRQTYSRWDGGRTVISSLALHRIALDLGVGIDYFFPNFDEVAAADQAMLRQYRQLPPERQKFVRDMMEKLSVLEKLGEP